MADNLKAALQKFVVGTATDDEKSTLQRALLTGNLVFADGERDIALGRDAHDAVIITGDNNYVHIELRETRSENILNRLFSPTPGIVPPLPAFIFIGREDALLDIKILLGLFMPSTSGPQFAIVHGWPGVGKTTLVATFARDPDIAKAFPDGVLWTSLGQRPRLLSEVAVWGRALGVGEILQAPTLKEATTQLARALHTKRVLLIVDDVWEPEHAIPFQQARGPGCALLVTTRLPAVAEALAPSPKAAYNLPVLRAYPSRGTARQVMRARAKCSMAR